MAITETPPTTASETTTVFRTCPLCEAGCGLQIELDGPKVKRIRGDRQDVFSHGFVCPKGSTLKQLHEDPDWLRQPMIKRDGRFEPATWDEAFAEIEARLLPIIAEHGRDAVGAYAGNPNAHNLAGQLYLKPLLRALGSTNVFSASTVDQRPKEIASALMFGGGLTVAVPDLDRTDHLLLIGANPLESNGSLATAPDWPGRLEALLARGGTLVVVDPRRTRTAELATTHVAIRPGTDALLLAAMVQVLVADDLVDPGAVSPHLAGLDQLGDLVAPFTPDAVAGPTGVGAATIRRLAHNLAAAPTAAVYGRIGTCTAEFGTLASWLVDVLNICTGNLDRPGGAMFTKAAVGAGNTRGKPGSGRGVTIARRHSRVRGLPESLGELPVVAMAEEIETPGEGQIRAVITVGGNPALSTPNSARLDAALETLDFMVSVDPYLNETTRHADVVLPVPSALQKGHYDIALLQLAIRNVANWSPAVFPLADGQPDEWEVLARLALVIQGAGAEADPAIVDDLMVDALISASTADETSPIHGRDPAEIRDALAPRRGPARLVDLLLRTGPYGDGFGARTEGPCLTLDVLIDHPHGVDLGPLEPRLPEVLRTPSGKVELTPAPIVADLGRLRDSLDRDHDGILLVGRRDVRSNNSWMHNVEVLVKGRPRCTLHVHPDDAERLGLVHEGSATVTSRVGKLVAPVHVTESIRPGVVSLPHGWGHDQEGVELEVAGRYPGVNANLLTDEMAVDALSGNAVLNGVPVEVTPA